MLTINDCLEEAHYNLGRTIANVKAAIALAEDQGQPGEQVSELSWLMDEFLDRLIKAQNCKLPAPNRK